MNESQVRSEDTRIGQPFNPFRLFTGIFIPDGMVRSTSISPGAKLTYARLIRSRLPDLEGLCLALQGTTAKIGTRLIAGSIHASRRLVIDSLRRLEARGHIQKATVRRGEREIYVLNSLVFGQKQRAGIEEVISSPSRTPRLASVRRA